MFLLIMELKFISITLSVIKCFSINLIPINRALQRLFTSFDRFLMALKFGILVGAEFTVIVIRWHRP